MTPRVPLLLAGLLLALGGLAGCQGDGNPAPATGPGLPSQADLNSYFQAITSADPHRLGTAASDLAASGSPAQGYATYVSQVSLASAAAGSPIDPADVAEVDGGFKACASADQCVTWSHFQGKDGKLTDFSVNGTRLDDLLVNLTGQPPIESTGLYQVQPEWAYRLPLSATLNVVVAITAWDVPLSARAGLYVESDRVLKGGEPTGPTVEPGASSPVVLPFPKAQDAKLDGQVTFELRLGGRRSEPIGFGLTAPAS